MFSIYAALSVSAIPVGAICGALATASFERRRDAISRDAFDLWRAIQLRNGVTALSPWHSSVSPINRPGMVEVMPNYSGLDPPLHPWESEPIPGEGPPSSPDGSNPPENTGSTGSALLDEPIAQPLALTDPPAAGEQARVLRLHQQGLSQTAIIQQVWGVPRGGSKKYKEARRRYLDYIAPKEVTTHA